MKNENKTAEVQGTETKTEKLPSPTVCLKTMAATIRRMEKLKMLNESELKTIKTIQNDMVKRWIGGSLNV